MPLPGPRLGGITALPRPRHPVLFAQHRLRPHDALPVPTGRASSFRHRSRRYSAPTRWIGRPVSLHETIETDLREAMRSRDKPRTSALRMLVASLKNRAVADGLGAQGRLDDEVVQQA